MASENSLDDILDIMEYEDSYALSVESVQSRFTKEQKEYIEKTPVPDRRAQPALGIHFHQLQEPISYTVLVTKEEKTEELPPVEFEREEKAPASKKRKKAHKGYPRTYFDPTDKEIEPKDGKTYVYFNVEKSLRKYHLTKITKVISKAKLEKWTYDKPFFDKIAAKQHKRAEKLNAMTADQQYKHDLKVKLAVISIGLFLVMFVFLYIVGVYIPSSRFDKGGSLMVAEKYDEAYKVLIDLGQYNNSHIYAKYCEGQMQIKYEHYDAAKECFKLLLDYQSLFNDAISIEKLVQKCDYLKAKDLYNESKFEEAQALFKSVYQYEDATTYYYKCSCEIADSYYTKGDLYSAIENMYEAGSAGYADSHDRLLNIADELYNEGMTAYKALNYEKAEKIFNFLGDYKFKDSEDMYTQCSYSYAMANFKSGNYTDAESCFSKISYYKDSLALMKECSYRVAQQTAADNPVKSIRLYENLKDYKDANKMVTSDMLLLYGRWNIVAQNDSTIEPIEFSFYDGGRFYTKTQINGVAISTDATPYHYIWEENRFSAMDGAYEMTINKVNSTANNAYAVNEIYLTCSYNGNEYIYRCERLMTYTEMIKADNTVSESEDYTLTLNQQIEQEIKQYVDKKTDGYIVINGESVDVTGKNTRLTNGLGSKTSEERKEEKK